MNAHWAELIAKEHTNELRRDAERTRLGAVSRADTTAPADSRRPLPTLIGRLVIVLRRGLA